MKKFLKTCLIIALILLLVGFGLSKIGGRMTVKEKISEVVESVTNGTIQMDFSGLEKLGNNAQNGIEDIFDNVIDTIDEWDVHYDIDSETNFSKEYSIVEGDIEKWCPGENITKLNIAVGGCAFDVKTSGDDRVYVEVKNAYKYQNYVEGNVLYIKSTMGSATWDEMDDCEITLYLPANYEFEEVDFEIGAGVVRFGELYAKKAEFDVGAGQLVVNNLHTPESTFSVGAGSVELTDMDVEVLDVEVGMGKCSAQGNVAEKADVECAMGSVELKLNGSERDFNYKIEGAMGNVTLGDNIYSGMAQEKTIANGASKDMLVECAMGSIVIKFAE